MNGPVVPRPASAEAAAAINTKTPQEGCDLVHSVASSFFPRRNAGVPELAIEGSIGQCRVSAPQLPCGHDSDRWRCGSCRPRSVHRPDLAVIVEDAPTAGGRRLGLQAGERARGRRRRAVARPRWLASCGNLVRRQHGARRRARRRERRHSRAGEYCPARDSASAGRARPARCRARASSFLGGEAGQEMPHQLRNVLAALAERRTRIGNTFSRYGGPRGSALPSPTGSGRGWWPRSGGNRRAPNGSRRPDRPRPPAAPRSSLTCASSGSSPTSSRNSVPPCASWNLPACFSVAPVKAPRSWPKQDRSRRDCRQGPAVHRHEGLGALRSPEPWMARAISSPTPLSPSTRIGIEPAARRASAMTRSIAPARHRRCRGSRACRRLRADAAELAFERAHRRARW